MRSPTTDTLQQPLSNPFLSSSQPIVNTQGHTWGPFDTSPTVPAQLITSTSMTNVQTDQQESIDLEPTIGQESHFVGSGAIPGLALNEADSTQLSSSTLSFRQVSSDPRLPAFFVKHQSLMYGRIHTSGKWSYDAVCKECIGSIDDVTSKAISL